MAGTDHEGFDTLLPRTRHARAMGRADLLRRRVQDIDLDAVDDVASLVAQLEKAGGFTAKKVGVAADILRRMFRREACTTFLSFPAALVATGTRGVLRTLVQRRLVDVVITTCGTVDHDLARRWRPYYHGDFAMDDEALLRLGVHRLGNVLVPKESYGPLLERKVQPFLRKLWREGVRAPSTRELLWAAGDRLGNDRSILYWCAKNRIPVYVPAIFDGAFGSQLWSFWQDHREFRVDELRDEQELADLVLAAKETGALMVGGGVSKHHTIWWNQFRGGLDYAVYVTTAAEWDGSLSGARMREGVSWGKVKARARRVTVEGDATVLLPLLIAATLQGGS
jgi:deoxyhypusine synthase